MSLGTKAGFIHRAVSSTGRATINLPLVPATTLLFVTITGTASIDLEISDDNSLFIPVATITQNSVVQFAIPASVLAANITAVSGTVTVTYRTILLANMPSETLLIYGTDGVVTSPIILPTQNFTEAFPLVRKKLAQLQAANSIATIYTVPASTETEVVHIRAVNTDSSDRTLKLTHDGTADSNIILPHVNIVAGGWAEFDGKILMQTGDTLGAEASVAAKVTVTVYGYEKATA